jgi:hypothetical protein
MDVFWRMTMSKIEVRLNDFVAEEIGVPEKTHRFATCT